MQGALAFNAVLIGVVFFLAMLFAPRDFTDTGWDRFIFGLALAWWTFCLSALGWTIYVAVHFISKYW